MMMTQNDDTTRKLKPYQSRMEHLQDEFNYTRALLQRHLDPATDEVDALRSVINARLQASKRATVELPLLTLTRALKLSPVERDILLVLAALSLDPGFAGICQLAWAQFDHQGMIVARVCDIVSRTLADRFESITAMYSPDGPLQRYGLIHLDISVDARNIHDQPIKISPLVVDKLLGVPIFNRHLTPYSQVFHGAFDGLHMEPEVIERSKRAFSSACESSLRLNIWGSPGCGKKRLAKALLSEQSRGLLVIELAPLLFAAPDKLAQALHAARLECLLTNSVVYLDQAPFGRDGVPESARPILSQFLHQYGKLVIVGSRYQVVAPDGSSRDWVSLQVPLPGQELRQLLLQEAFSPRALLESDKSIELVAKQFPLSGGALQQAVREAEHEALISDEWPFVSHQHLVKAARGQLSGALDELATRLDTRLSWDSVMLSSETNDRLGELREFAAQRERVLGEWGFGAEYGNGVTALFHGPPGTGKTMVASVIAGELGLELFKVDLGRIVSKWVGETEKNLGRLFDAAQHSHAVLLFDEADALFAKRTDVKSSNDRYANLEVNYLLQRMEQFNGVTILTTNLSTGIDEAFQRRLRFRIHFPFPEADIREQLWKKLIPRDAPLDPAIAQYKWEQLGKKYELSGGHIKNATQRAASRASGRDDIIRYDDLRQAAVSECKEIGKLVRS